MCDDGNMSKVKAKPSHKVSSTPKSKMTSAAKKAAVKKAAHRCSAQTKKVQTQKVAKVVAKPDGYFTIVDGQEVLMVRADRAPSNPYAVPPSRVTELAKKAGILTKSGKLTTVFK